MSLLSEEIKAVWVLENVHHNRNFSMREIELLYIMSSVIQWKSLYPNIPTYLICTSEVYSYFCDIDIIYLWDHIDLQALSRKDEIDRKTFWACSKIKAMQSISAPFVMLDNDLYLRRNVIVPEDFQQYSVIASHEEHGAGYYLLSSDESFDVLDDKYPPDYRGKSYNVSFLYIKDEAFKRKYSEKGFRWMELLSKKRGQADFNLHGGHMIFCEQKLLYDMVQAEEVSCKVLIPDLFDCKKNVFLTESDIQSQIDHLGPLKRYIESKPEELQTKKSNCLMVLKEYPNLKHLFKALKKSEKNKYDHFGKFWLSSKLNPYVEPSPIKHYNRNRESCAVYVLWDEFRYVPYLKYSLLSLLVSTDIKEKADILIFVSESIYRQTVGCLSGLVSEDCFIEVKDIKAFKYMIPTHTALRGYKRLAMMDSDAFFIGKMDFFGRIEHYYSFEGRSKKILMCPDKNSGKTVFWDRKKDLCKTLNNDQYEEFFRKNIGDEGYEKMMENRWWISCVTVFTDSVFREEDFGSFALENFWLKQMCDETVFISWSYKNKYQLDTIESITYFSDRYQENKKPSIYHTIIGKNTTSIENEKMISVIEKTYSDLLRSLDDTK
jgi:hypothetical protein